MTDEDIKVNSATFLWPKFIEPLFDSARLKLLTAQEKAVAKVQCVIEPSLYAVTRCVSGE